MEIPAGAKVEEEQEDQEKNPQIINLKWIKDGEEIDIVKVDTNIIMEAETKDIKDGTRVIIEIYPKDNVDEAFLMRKVSASV